MYHNIYNIHAYSYTYIYVHVHICTHTNLYTCKITLRIHNIHIRTYTRTFTFGLVNFSVVSIGATPWIAKVDLYLGDTSKVTVRIHTHIGIHTFYINIFIHVVYSRYICAF